MVVVRDWFEDSGGLNLKGDKTPWPIGRAIYSQWRQWRDYGVYPDGRSWREQPLPLLVQFSAIGATHSVYQRMDREGAKLTDLTQAQNELKAWVDNG